MLKRGLGKGLEALLTMEEPDSSNVKEVKINDIEPNKNQPRRTFDQEKINEMAESIREFGIIQPLVVRTIDDKYEIIAGERRWRAARVAGLNKVPVVIREFTDKEVMEAALIENLQREDLNPIEEAKGYENLIKDYDMTQEDISKIIGKSRPAVANTLRLLSLDDRVKHLVINNDLTSGHARALVVIKDGDIQYEIAKKIIANGLNVRDTETLIKNFDNKKVIKTKQKDPIYVEIEDSLKNILGTKVKILNNKNKGKIEIEYYSQEDLERIIEMLKR